MSDQNRGAYSPQSDAPLAFDPREPRGRGPAPMTLLVSAIILMGLIVGVLLFYRHGARPEGAAGTPQLVGAPVGDTKSAPPPTDAAPSDQAAGLQVYRTEATPSGEGASPNFETTPEQPAPLPPARPVAPPPPVIAEAPLRPAKPAPAAPRPAPKPVAVAKAAPAPAASLPAPADMAAAPSHAAPAPAHAPVSAAAKPVAAKPVSVEPAAGAAKPKPAPKTEVATAAPAAPMAKPTTTAPAPGGGALVQIGAFSSDALAQKGLADAAAVAPGGKSHKVEAASKDGKTFYRAFVGGFASHADAVAYCEALKARGKACFVK